MIWFGAINYNILGIVFKIWKRIKLNMISGYQLNLELFFSL